MLQAKARSKSSVIGEWKARPKAWFIRKLDNRLSGRGQLRRECVASDDWIVCLENLGSMGNGLLIYMMA